MSCFLGWTDLLNNNIKAFDALVCIAVLNKASCRPQKAAERHISLFRACTWYASLWKHTPPLSLTRHRKGWEALPVQSYHISTDQQRRSDICSFMSDAPSVTERKVHQPECSYAKSKANTKDVDSAASEKSDNCVHSIENTAKEFFSSGRIQDC